MDQKQLPDHHISTLDFQSELTLKQLEHIGSCEYCSSRFAEHLEEISLLKAPRDFEETVLSKINHLDTQIISNARHISKRMKLFWYGIKIGTGVLASILMLSFLPNLGRAGNFSTSPPLSKFTEIDWNYYKQVQLFTGYLNQFSRSDLEDIKHDKKEE